jgi:hypothetical protein
MSKPRHNVTAQFRRYHANGLVAQQLLNFAADLNEHGELRT